MTITPLKFACSRKALVVRAAPPFNVFYAARLRWFLSYDCSFGGGGSFPKLLIIVVEMKPLILPACYHSDLSHLVLYTPYTYLTWIRLETLNTDSISILSCVLLHRGGATLFEVYRLQHHQCPHPADSWHSAKPNRFARFCEVLTFGEVTMNNIGVNSA